MVNFSIKSCIISFFLLFMPNIHFIDQNGEKTTIDAPVGLSLLEVAHQNNIDLEGACEGSLACSTCHVIVNDDWYKKLIELNGEICEDEEDMLDMAYGLTQTSRLGCQIIITKELEGLTVMLPPGSRNFSVS